jgi:NAD(P)-dependent dehydrogenase (short-subunit alcohol dehydrogenase family)
MPDLTGRTILVTGANSGLGLRSAEALAANGAHVLMGCRNGSKADRAWDEVAALATGPKPTVVKLDLADLASVRACAEEVAATVDHLDVLMNNAGVMALPLARTADGFEMQFGTNHLGHFALTGRLLPTLAKATAPRVVTTASLMHWAGRMRWDDLNADRRRYLRWPAYSASKLANLLFIYELDRRARTAGSDLVSVGAHPGYASTHLQERGGEQSGRRLTRWIWALGNTLVAQSDAQGARPQLYAATAPGVEGGRYFGPRFELWGPPRRTRSSRTSRSPEAGRRLWEVSEELTGVTYSFR